MMPPDWLKLREGSLKIGVRPQTLFVILGGKPQYRLDVRPAGGSLTCDVTQTVNGHGLGDDKHFSTEAEALAGALERLRDALGW